MGRRVSKILEMIATGVLVLCAAEVALGQINENCTVSVLNRTVRVNPDGSWVLPNIPANFGQVKARATCVQNGVTTSGESDFFTVPVNGAVNLPTIRRSEEHTSELQSLAYLVCRLLLEKKKQN